jgi:hypothetical protein
MKDGPDPRRVEGEVRPGGDPAAAAARPGENVERVSLGGRGLDEVPLQGDDAIERRGLRPGRARAIRR